MVGIDTAKAFSFATKKPLVAVNHMESHIYSNFIPENGREVKIDFPALCLITSGGHTELVLMKDHGKYKEIGSTRDDASGEAFDKVAKLLDIGYPGGPVISKKADMGNAKAYSFPRPMISDPNFDFSFSGLKTDVLRLVNKKRGKFSDQEINDICASFQMAVVDVLTNKTIKAAKKYKVKSLMLAGGVSANKLLRRKMESLAKRDVPDTKFCAPNLKYCTDNAAMVAQAAYYHAVKKDFTPFEKVEVNPSLKLT
jgi:N6-L-threonylcarbamoyladenine synthase